MFAEGDVGGGEAVGGGPGTISHISDCEAGYSTYCMCSYEYKTAASQVTRVPCQEPQENYS